MICERFARARGGQRPIPQRHRHALNAALTTRRNVSNQRFGSWCVVGLRQGPKGPGWTIARWWANARAKSVEFLAGARRARASHGRAQRMFTIIVSAAEKQTRYWTSSPPTRCTENATTLAMSSTSRSVDGQVRWRWQPSQGWHAANESLLHRRAASMTACANARQERRHSLNPNVAGARRSRTRTGRVCRAAPPCI